MKPFAIVTGANRGIGFAVAQYLVEKDYDLGLIGRNQGKLETVQHELKQRSPHSNICIGVVDLSVAKEAYQAVQSMIRSKGRIDLIINNAGVLSSGTEDISIDDFEALFKVNVFGMMAVAKAGIEQMEKQGFGYLMNVSSMLGRRALSVLGAYGASKYAVTGFSESLFKKYTQAGIKITAICPSIIDTDMTKDDATKNHDKIQVSDIVKTIDYLLSLSPTAVVPVSEVWCRVRCTGI